MIIYKLSNKLDSWQEIKITDLKKRQHTIQDLTSWTSYDVCVIFEDKSGIQSTSNVMPYLVTDTGKLFQTKLHLYSLLTK